MKSLDRVFTALGQQEPDRVPLFLPLTVHGAKELGLSIKEYFSKAENVVKGQLILREKYQNDFILPFFYAATEVEAFGGEVIYFDNNPPNSGKPFIQDFSQIHEIKVPDINNTPCLTKALKAIRLLKEKVQDDVPIIGVVVSPYSLPVMQMGFDKYIEVLYNRPDDFKKLMEINEAFCVSWANAQLDAGATAICYFDPLASPKIVNIEKYRETGFKVAKRVVASIDGPTAIHMASAPAIPIIEELVEIGAGIVGLSALDNIAQAKKIANKRITVLGNLNALEMISWKPGEAEEKIKELIRQGAKGGGFVISDNHGEIPWQVSEEILLEISMAVQKWGQYPLDWI
jgi:uroporphyrinogen decarboxylase